MGQHSSIQCKTFDSTSKTCWPDDCDDTLLNRIDGNLKRPFPLLTLLIRFRIDDNGLFLLLLLLLLRDSDDSFPSVATLLGLPNNN